MLLILPNCSKSENSSVGSSGSGGSGVGNRLIENGFSGSAGSPSVLALILAEPRWNPASSGKSSGLIPPVWSAGLILTDSGTDASFISDASCLAAAPALDSAGFGLALWAANFSALLDANCSALWVWILIDSADCCGFKNSEAS